MNARHCAQVIARALAAGEAGFSADEAGAASAAGAASFPRVLGVAGPPGSGKTTIAQALPEALRAEGIPVAGLVPMDGFHLSNTVLEARGIRQCKGAPDTFDVDGYVSMLERVRACDGVVLAPDYRRDLHEPVAASLEVTSRGVAITEGNYLGYQAHGWERVRPLIDVLVYVDVPTQVIFQRLIARHQRFGRDKAEAAHWVRTVDAANVTLVEATRSLADLVVR